MMAHSLSAAHAFQDGPGQDKPAYLREEGANPGERRNMCVISNNSSVVEWQEQVCSLGL